eukprot:CAMPEP_0185746150 /NCGR_PEP_ID=MMETSP1174-20130828/4599_1 /TAXON_ID=35687 /ORGANISM="Dictyocha speculum, Strain CCMP1381" /LENGTH=40 /DNA_ID= /DNA_START= /DNA_END= /DNA_ORIENTATION=
MKSLSKEGNVIQGEGGRDSSRFKVHNALTPHGSLVSFDFP